jgi:hypothetical protein
MQTIPLQQVPSQTLQTVLNGQNVSISVYTRSTGLYVDTSVNGVPTSAGVIAMNQVPVVPTNYLGFAGNLLFTDTQGTEDPTYTGLGSRFLLVYLTAAEYATLGVL